MIHTKKHIDKFIALSLCILLMSVTIFSITLLALEFHHDCDGEDCLICNCIHLLEQYDEVGIFVLPVFLSVTPYISIMATVILVLTSLGFSHSLFDLKVRLNN